MDCCNEGACTKLDEDILDIPLDDPDANAAAAKIQASFRGHMTRKKIKGVKLNAKARTPSVQAAPGLETCATEIKQPGTREEMEGTVASRQVPAGPLEFTLCFQKNHPIV